MDSNVEEDYDNPKDSKYNLTTEGHALPMSPEENVVKNESIAEFTCGCKYAEGKPCSSLFSENFMQKMREQSQKIDYYKQHTNQLDVVILGILRALTCTEAQTRCTKKIQRERKNSRAHLMLGGYQVCRTTFCFAHTISMKRYKRLKKIFLKDGLVEPQHGNTNVKPIHSNLPEDETRAINFIREYAETHALLLPGRHLKLLPVGTIKKNVHKLYIQSCKEQFIEPLSRTTFCKLWMSNCNEITIMKPTAAQSKGCQKHSTSPANDETLSPKRKRMELLPPCSDRIELFGRLAVITSTSDLERVDEE